MSFTDRIDAGRRLAPHLQKYANEHPLVIGLPRGGVPVAREVADALHAPLDVIVVRKIGVPGHEELGLGAISEDGVVVYNDDVRTAARVPEQELQAALARERATLAQRLQGIRAQLPQAPLAGRTVIIVDDGVATGIDARAACRVARLRGAKRVVLATPAAPDDWRRRLAGEADDFVAVEESPFFGAVGEFYDDFSPTSDEEVLACLLPGS